MTIRHVAVILLLSSSSWAAGQDVYASRGRMPDSTAKIVAELREADSRRMPIDVMLKVSPEYSRSSPIEVTIVVTNLFDEPLLLNTRMLVNHPLLQGEVAFRITNPRGKTCEIRRLVTPLTVREEDFVKLARGMSIQRSIDLSDLYPIQEKGTYKIQAIYHNEVEGLKDGLRAWRGLVRSDTAEFTLN
jgi:hypothetical protein